MVEKPWIGLCPFLVVLVGLGNAHAQERDAEELTALLEESGALAELQAFDTIEYGDDFFDKVNAEWVSEFLGEPLESGVSMGAESIGQTESYLIRVDTARSVLSIAARLEEFSAVPAEHQVDEATIRQLAGELFADLGLAPEGGFSVHIGRILHQQRGPSGPLGAPQPLLYSVTAEPVVGKYILWGQKARLAFGLDGALIKCFVRWPKVDIGPHHFDVASNASITERALAALAGHPFMDAGRAVELSTGLVVEEGQIRRVLLVRGRLLNPRGDEGRAAIVDVRL